MDDVILFILCAAAMEYLLHHMRDPVDVAAFEGASGVGVVVTPDQIEASVEAVINKHKEELLEKRYRVNTGMFIGSCDTIEKKERFSKPIVTQTGNFRIH